MRSTSELEKRSPERTFGAGVKAPIHNQQAHYQVSTKKTGEAVGSTTKLHRPETYKCLAVR
jgi:hypothetical protein